MKNSILQIIPIIIFTIGLTFSSSVEFDNLYAQQSSPSLEKAEEFETYENLDNGIKINYPSKWIKNEPGTTIGIEPYTQTNIVSFSSAPSNDPTFMVIVGKLPVQVQTLEDFANVGISEHKMMYPDFNLVKSGNVDLAGIPGYNFSYTASDENGKFTGLQIWTIKDDKFYLLVSTVSNYLYPLAWPTIQKMIDSFEIIN